MQYCTKQLVALLLLTFAFVGCGDEFFDKSPKGQLSSASFWSSAAEAELGLNAVYGYLNQGNWGGFELNNWIFGDVASDDFEKGGGSDGDQRSIFEIENFTFLLGNSKFQQRWEDCYEVITRANLVLGNVPVIDMNEERRSGIVAEARFLRALAYFQLLNVFKDVPLITQPLAVSELAVPKNPRAEVWAFMMEDLRQAANVLPVQQEVGRVTRGAALALLAKCHIHRSEWQLALDPITELEALGVYDLDPNYQNNFTLAGENNEESIFELQHSANTGQATGAMIFGGSAPRDGTWWPFGCCGFNVGTEDLVAEFEVGDPRLDFTLGLPGRVFFEAVYADSTRLNDGTLVARTNLRLYNKKGLLPPSQMAEYGIRGWQGGSPLNYTLIRYADVLLWQAEALNELGRTEEAEAPLNRVRARARDSYAENPNSFEVVYNSTDGNILRVGDYIPPPDDFLPDVSGLSQEAMREAIYHERRVELAGEGHRFFDLRRWGILGDELRAEGKNFVDGVNEFFPLPQAELDVNPALVQDPAYD